MYVRWWVCNSLRARCASRIFHFYSFARSSTIIQMKTKTSGYCSKGMLSFCLYFEFSYLQCALLDSRSMLMDILCVISTYCVFSCILPFLHQKRARALALRIVDKQNFKWMNVKSMTLVHVCHLTLFISHLDLSLLTLRDSRNLNRLNKIVKNGNEN